MKYYFITYQASNRHGVISTWQEVINVSPMEFIEYAADTERKSEMGNMYYNFVIINTCEISEDDFNKFKDCF